MTLSDDKIASWIENPTVQLGAESDYWRNMEKYDPNAKQNPDLIRAFLWLQAFIKALTANE